MFNFPICDGQNVPPEDQCDDGFATWWPKLAEKVWSWDTVNEVCFKMIGCEINPVPKFWDCETCKVDMVTMINAITQDEFMVQRLEGPAFCEDPANGGWFPEICKNYVREFVPRALQTWLELGYEQPQLLCNFFFQLC